MLLARNMDLYTKLCLNRPLADGSTTFLDGSLRNHAITAYGNTKWSNGSQKFGQNTCYLGDSNTNYLSINDDADFDFGSDNFTIDAWVYLTTALSSNSDARTIAAKWANGTTGCSFWFCFYHNGTSQYLIFRRSETGDVSPVLNITNTISIGTNEWKHVAVCRSSPTNTKLYYNGSAITTNYTNYTIATTNTNLLIGRHSGSTATAFKGYIAQPRISKGIARWTGNFTPPKNPYM